MRLGLEIYIGDKVCCRLILDRFSSKALGDFPNSHSKPSKILSSLSSAKEDV